MTNKTDSKQHITAIRENASLGCLTWRSWSELEMHFDKNSFWFTSEIPSPIFNTIVELDPSSPICESYLFSIAEQLPYQETPLAWMIPQEASINPNLLQRHNYLYLGSTRGMICDLTDWQKEESNAPRVTHVTNDDELYDWANVISEAYHFHNDCKYPWFDLHRSIDYGEGSLWEHFVISDDTQAVAACSIFWGPEVPSLANVAVLPEKQGSGFGKTIVEHALTFVKEMIEPDYITLYATEEAFPMYKKIGFEQVCSTDIYQRAKIIH